MRAGATSVEDKTSEWRSFTLVPLHKTNDRKVCNNYRGISLFNVPGKVLAVILLQAIIELQLMVTQCGFRKGRSTVDQIWVTRPVVEKAREYQTPVYLGLSSSPRHTT